MAEQRSPFTKTAALGWGLVGAVVVALVGIAAGVGSPLAAPPLPYDRSPGWRPTDPGSPIPRTTMPEHTVDESLVVLLKVFVAIFAVAILVAIVVGIVRLFRGSRTPRLERRTLEPDEVSVLTIALPDRMYVRSTPEIVDAFDESRTLLVDGSDPRAAIIAAWLRLELAAEAAGVGRAPTDTPTDLVTRLVMRSADAHHALTTLADIYRRARFAPQEPTERDRGLALEALEVVRDQLMATAAYGSAR